MSTPVGHSTHMRVVPGTTARSDVAPAPRGRRRKLSVDDYVTGVTDGDRTILGRTFSLMESRNPEHREMAAEVLSKLAPRCGNSYRVGISGLPGAGKSTFIERFGMQRIEEGLKVAVLTIDPSSERTGGSILGDKTRMESLSRHPNAFVRPTACGRTHGGVARGTRESILVCEAAGFDVVCLETVGVGQSETVAASMVDFFVLILIAGGGDELQGMKRGILEVADTVLFNKSDGDNKRRSELARAELQSAMRLLRPSLADWTPRVMTCSALTGEGLPEIWQVLSGFREAMEENGEWDERRRQQALSWMRQAIETELLERFERVAGVDEALKKAEADVAEGKTSPFRAAESLVRSAWPETGKEDQPRRESA